MFNTNWAQDWSDNKSQLIHIIGSKDVQYQLGQRIDLMKDYTILEFDVKLNPGPFHPDHD